MTAFPVLEVMPQLLSAIDHHHLVILSAPPGSGKTTQVPLSLINSGLFKGRILLLQPRRVAARSVATWMAHLLDEPVGHRIGYQVRHERVISTQTQVEVLTEGLIIQRLLSDPELSDVDLIIIDEFHERNILTDVTLMLLLEAQVLSREDLKLIIMSATLDTQLLADRFNAPVITAKGRSYPLQISYISHQKYLASTSMIRTLVREINHFWLRDSTQNRCGHCLVFLPGKREIEQAKEQLLIEYPQSEIAVLYGALPLHQQRKVLDPSQKAKIILATNIAETSLTIDGVTHVIDSGLHRSSRFDQKTGLSRLVTLNIAHDSATQRAGRAGRTQGGLCLRLWSEHDHQQRATQTAPEVSYISLVDIILKVTQWSGDWRLFEWFEDPPEQSLAAAHDELIELGAIALESYKLTPLGEILARLPIHPRKGLALIWGKVLNCLDEVSFMCALSELSYDPLQNNHEWTGLDPWIRWTVYQKEQCESPQSNRLFSREFTLTIRQLKKNISRIDFESLSFDIPKYISTLSLKECVAFALTQAMPRSIAKRRERSREAHEVVYHLSGGGEAKFKTHVYCEEEPLLVVLKARLNRHNQPMIELALPISNTWLSPVEKCELYFDARLGGIYESRKGCLGHLVLWEKCHPAPQHSSAAQELFKSTLQKDLWKWIPLDSHTAQWLERLSWIKSQSELLEYVESKLGSTAPDWSCIPTEEKQELMSQFVDFIADQKTHINQLSIPQNILSILKGLTPVEWIEIIDLYAPPIYVLPTGQHSKVLYEVNKPPIIKAYLQAFFGENQHPYIGPTHSLMRVPIQLHLLAPNQRVAQITSDLPLFWQSSYAEVRRDLRGRYPKHHWPENPLSIGPQKGAKRRSKKS